MKKEFLGILTMVMGIMVILMGNLKSVEATTTVSGAVSGTWGTVGNPYIVVGTVTVEPGNTLIVEPGVVVKFATDTVLISYGILSAIGEESNKIVFTSLRDETNGQGTSTIAQAGDYYGIKLLGNGSNRSIIKYCVIKYGKQALCLENINNVIMACFISSFYTFI